MRFGNERKTPEVARVSMYRLAMYRTKKQKSQSNPRPKEKKRLEPFLIGPSSIRSFHAVRHSQSTGDSGGGEGLCCGHCRPSGLFMSADLTKAAGYLGDT